MDLKMGDRSLPVDLIRTVAIILVILLHAATEPYEVIDIMSPEEVFRWWTINIYDSIAKLCVPLFLMLSGALLLQPSKLTEPMGIFFKKRVNRVALPIIFWGVAYFAWRIFVNHEVITLDIVWQGILNGPYIHFWFLYLLIGLYLLTPILRVIVGHADWKTVKYFLLLWFIGTAIVPLQQLFSTTSLNPNVFLITGWIGFFLIGAYLPKIKIRTVILVITVLLGTAWTIIGTYIVTGTIGERLHQFFYDSFSFNIIITSIALFLLLWNLPKHQIENRSNRINNLLHQIGQNTLPIYLVHLMIMESIQKGYFGFRISITTMNPALEIPLITALTFFISFGIVYLLKKIPFVKSIIG